MDIGGRPVLTHAITTAVVGALLGACALSGAPVPRPQSAPEEATAPTPTSAPSPSQSPSQSPLSTPSVSPAVGTPHVFVIVMENTSLAQAMAQKYIAGLAKQYAVATNYHAIGSPSLPNYLALTSGSTWGITDDGYHVLPAGGLGAQLDQAGISWRAYMEGLTGAGCLNSPGPYALKHNPFAYYGGACPSNVVPLDALAQDLVGATANFVWITPDLCHDGHDCPLRTAADWLAGIVPQITASPAWNDHGTLFITWDEADGATTLVPLIVLSPQAAGLSSAEEYDHYSLLATIEDAFHLPRLGQAKTARPMIDLVPQRP